jgi:TonB family protein
VDVAPEFPGGRSGLKAYLASRAYPQTERNAGHVAKVRVRFVVGSDGVPTNVKVLSSGYPGFDAEALRLVKAMPKWTPGKVNGSPVPVSTMVTVDFSLNE